MAPTGGWARYTAAMQANSSPIVSSQDGIHQQLAATVAKHAASTFRKPITAYNRQAFEASMAAWNDAAGGDTGSMPLILDTGCGVGLSTMHLATQFPDHFVIGIDQSADRLQRNTFWSGAAPRNFMLVRADLVDYWRLLASRRHPPGAPVSAVPESVAESRASRPPLARASGVPDHRRAGRHYRMPQQLAHLCRGVCSGIAATAPAAASRCRAVPDQHTDDPVRTQIPRLRPQFMALPGRA